LEHSIKYKWLLVFWLIGVTILSLVKLGKISAITVENSDKYVHFIFYFITAFLFYMTLKSFSVHFFKRIALSFVFSVAYGIVIEVLQEVLTTSRHFEWGDIIANSLGAFFSLILISILRIKINFFK